MSAAGCTNTPVERRDVGLCITQKEVLGSKEEKEGKCANDSQNDEERSGVVVSGLLDAAADVSSDSGDQCKREEQQPDRADQNRVIGQRVETPEPRCRIKARDHP